MQQIYSIRENDIFISYAPANLLFVKKLDTAIRSLGHDPWIDLEDLPIGIDLNQSIVWQYIKAGIQNANIFVFVLSSAFCHAQRNLEELELARQTGRRLIPVRLEAIDPADLPSCLNGLPQISVNSDQPDATIDRIAQVIVYLHTYERLQQKAQDWAAKTQDYETETDVEHKADKAEACQLALLRGTDLESVESWLEQGEDLDRDLRFLKIATTPLQNQYIAASRAADQAYKKHTEIDSIYRPSYETYDVFISYSRRDKAAFVEYLCAALQEQGKKVWVDWQNIPVAAPWRQQIREGIIGADNFLFVISADSAASKNCREELSQAIENQKRLIGILWRSDYRKQGLFDRESSLAKLKDYNWISFNNPVQEGVFDPTVFAQNFPELIQTIEVDAAQVAQHTRLLMQAQEWNTHNRNRDFLLTGKRVAEATQWLRQCSQKKTPLSKTQHANLLIFWWKWYRETQQNLAAPSQLAQPPAQPLAQQRAQQWSINLISYLQDGRFKHDIQPTDLQKKYIQVSYDVQRERRIGLGVLVSGVTAALVALGLFGLTATRGKIEALVASLEENQELDALVTGLRAGAELERFSPVLNLTDRNLPIRVITALQQQVYNLREQNRLLGHTKQVYNASFSADGQFLVSASEDGSIRLWNQHGKLLAVATEGGSVTMMGQSGQVAPLPQTAAAVDGAPQTSQRPIVNAIFNPGVEAGTYLLASAGDGNEIKLWQVKQNSNQLWQVKLSQRLSVTKTSGDRIYTIQFSQGGQVLAAASSDGTVQLWRRNSANQFVLVHTLQQRNPVYALSFSHVTRQGEHLAFADAKGNLRLLTSRNLFQTYREVVLHHGDQAVLTVQFSPNAQWLASGSKDGTIKLWNLQGTPHLQHTLRGHEDRVYRIAFSPNGQSIASASEDGSVRLWWQEQGKWDGNRQFKVLRGHQAAVYRVEFSPDGRTIASAGADDTIRFWSAEGTWLDTLNGHQDEVLSIEFAADGKTLVSSSKDKTVRLWQVESPVKVLPHNYRVYDVDFSSDGSMLASSGQNTIRLWRTTDGTAVLEPPITQQGRINSISLTTQGNRNPDAVQLLAAADDSKIKLWIIKRQQTGYGAIDAGTLSKGHDGAVNSVSLNQSGTLLASAGAEGTINLWQLQPQTDRYQVKLLQALPNQHPGGALSVSFSQNGKWLASSGADGVIHVWKLVSDGNRTTLQLYRSSKWHTGAVYSVSFSPDNRILASAGQDKTVRLWNLSTMQLSPQILTGHSDEVLKVSFSPTTNLLASASRDDTIKLWTIDGNLVTTLIRHRREVSSVQFSPDGQTLASASYDNLALLWQLSNTNLEQLLRQGCRLAADFLQIHPTPTASPQSGEVATDMQTFCQKTLNETADSSETSTPLHLKASDEEK